MLYIFDKDGTLVQDIDGKRPPNKLSEQKPIAGVLEKCQALIADGHLLAVASNQGGVAFGYITAAEAHEMVKQIADYIGATTYAVCVTHPNGKRKAARRESRFRKPDSGMIDYLMDAFGVLPSETVYIGDLGTDQQAAEAAGVKFIWAKDFFGWA
ncbi:MAG: HAD-IIIA family hydrolase [Anaerolineaceae bacterium]|nr:HAD-IIIA family hydrolase [Anaerolineaceae bacterium]